MTLDERESVGNNKQIRAVIKKSYQGSVPFKEGTPFRGTLESGSSLSREKVT